MKKIGIITTGGDCSGLNTAIHRIMRGAHQKGWTVIGIKDGTDGLTGDSLDTVILDDTTFPIENVRNAGSFLGNGKSNVENFQVAIENNKIPEFNAKMKSALKKLGLDALVLLGGNGSLSLAYHYPEIYSDLQLICIPKTIDKDVPLTENTIGFDTAVSQLVSTCDELLLTARGHHRWFVVQTMGRETGALALHSGVAMNAAAVLMPEVKFNTDSLIEHIKNQNTDYGIILVSEGITIRGHSGRGADMISRKLTAAGISNRAIFPEHIQRVGDTSATDRLLATRFADAAISAIENNETNVIVSLIDNQVDTVTLNEFFESGVIEDDPNLSNMTISSAYIESDDTLLSIAQNMGIYIGEVK